MSLIQIPQQGEEAFYDGFYRLSTWFPYFDDVFHILSIGAMPFLIGKYGSETIANICKDPEIAKAWRDSATGMGLACSIAAEILWSCVIEPGSRYDHPEDLAGKLKGVGETLAGVGIAALGECLWKSKEKTQ